MELVKVEVEVPKEAHELAQGIANVVAAVKVALADGWQAGTDLPILMTAALVELVPAVQGVEHLDDEAKAHPAAFSKALALGVADALEAALKKAE
jgi:hypothetical protein